MLIGGFLAYSIAYITRGLDIVDSQFFYLCLTLIYYSGIFIFVSGINYFGTTYQYEKHPEESVQAVIDKNDERNLAIRNLAKARTFDIITYVLIFLPFLLLDLKADLIGIAASGIALIILGLSYLYFYLKYSKEM